MLRALTFAIILLTAFGCSDQPENVGTTSSVPATEVTSKMIGTWGLGGQAGLILEQVQDQVVISAPPVEGLRMDISDAKIEGQAIHFVQKNYFLEMDSHPFNGVANNSSIRLIDDNTLEYRIKTIQLPEEYQGVLTRISNEP